MQSWVGTMLLAASLLTFSGIPTGANGSAVYTYDSLGRLRTALYDNGLCVAYNYDANGNRISQTNTLSDAPESPTWGAGYWGCFEWTP